MCKIDKTISKYRTDNNIFMILCSGQNSKDKAYKLSADYPYRANADKVVLSVAQSLYDTQSSVIGVSTSQNNSIID